MYGAALLITIIGASATMLIVRAANTLSFDTYSTVDTAATTPLVHLHPHK